MEPNSIIALIAAVVIGFLGANVIGDIPAQGQSFNSTSGVNEAFSVNFPERDEIEDIVQINSLQTQFTMAIIGFALFIITLAAIGFFVFSSKNALQSDIGRVESIHRNVFQRMSDSIIRNQDQDNLGDHVKQTNENAIGAAKEGARIAKGQIDPNGNS